MFTHAFYHNYPDPPTKVDRMVEGSKSKHSYLWCNKCSFVQHIGTWVFLSSILNLLNWIQAKLRIVASKAFKDNESFYVKRVLRYLCDIFPNFFLRYHEHRMIPFPSWEKKPESPTQWIFRNATKMFRNTLSIVKWFYWNVLFKPYNYICCVQRKRSLEIRRLFGMSRTGNR